MSDVVLTSASIESLPKIAEGKVRTLYEVDEKTLLFVATDRISAYDVIMDNVSSCFANQKHWLTFTRRAYPPRASS